MSDEDTRAQRELQSLRRREINFDPLSLDDPAWKRDDYCQALPGEPAGEPIENGSWQIARRLLRDYAFADPTRVRAIYDRGSSLEDRVMLLEIRFLGMRFDVGVRVEGVHDELRDVDGRRARIWGWSYRTLEGHLERGQMDYEVWKWLDSGAVEFRIHRRSRPAQIPNLWIALGFRMFGRREQVRFAQHACQRMLRLTEAELHSARAIPDDVDRVTA
jgi:uncharacterized protein (UPF0548 family)